MKLSNLFWNLLGIMVLSACSNSDMTENDLSETNVDARFMSVDITNTTGFRTRAAGDQSGDLYEEGESVENDVESVRFYFFKENGSPCPVKSDGTNYYDCKKDETESAGQDMPNIEKKLNAVIVINTREGDNLDQLKSMVAVINHEKIALGTASMDLATLRGKFGSYSYVKDSKFLMTSSVFGSDNFCCEVNIPASALKKTEDEAKKSPVNVYVERVLAKVRLYTDWKDMTLKNDVTYGDNDKKYTAVKLKKSKDGSEFIQVDSKDVYVIFTGWEVTSTASQSYLFKKVNSAWAFTPVWSWNHPEYHRSYWAMNPDGLTFDYLPYDQIAGKVGTQGASDNSSKSYNGTNLYCQENAADKYETGKKSSYNPATEVSNRTQAIIAAVLVTIDDSNVAHPIDLAKWGGTDYTKDNAMTAMLSVVQDQIYTKTIEGAGTADAKEIYTPITKDKVELVSGIKSDNADNESENSGRYLSYLQLKKGVTDTFYKADHTAYANLDDVNDVLANMPGARVWSSGQAYYYTDIKHLNDFPGVDDTDGKYGIVRNHIYDIAINSVSGLGTPVLDPEEVIVPQKPTNDETYLGARINILSWRVVKQNIDLEW